MSVGDVLERQIAARLRDATAAPLDTLHTVEVWDGAWDVLASPRRMSFRAPAALVSATAFELVDRGRPAFPPRQLQRGDEPPPPCLQVRVDVALTFVSDDPSASQRARDVLELAAAALPLLIDAAVEDPIRGTNLYAKTLYEAGMSAFALLGRRTVELAAAPPAPRLPESVRGQGGCLPGEVVWTDG